MQVEGGFLDGLDLRFDDGLNAIIGGRGTGKSSIIELMRYCLDVQGSSSDEDLKQAREQALSVLQDGQVTLSIESDGSDIMVTRSADGNPEGLEAGFQKPLIFSQMDVESLGLSSRGRLNIVDFFSSDSSSQRAQERKLLTQIQSLTVEIRNLLKEADQISDRLSGADAVMAELTRAEARSADISKTSVQLEGKQKQLEAISSQNSALSVRMEALRRAQETSLGYQSSISDLLLFGLSLDEWPENAGDDPLGPMRGKISKAEKQVESAGALVDEVVENLRDQIVAVEKRRAPLEEQARIIRREIEGLREGAGAAARQLAGLREQTAQLNSLRALRKQKIDRSKKVRNQRRSLLDELDGLRDDRFDLRQKIAKSLSEKLSPLIRLRLKQSAQHGEFISAITNSLRGSGLRYNELAQAIAQSMTPRELVEAAEEYDSSFLSSTAGITMERAERVASQLRSAGSELIIGVALEDSVEFELLDGSKFKSMSSLSVGQRCTVVLSILLQHPDRILIVDQPEDHLDNAFIVGTLIGAIRKRSASCQLIFSTHNANIPVLGEAARVVLLGSNGQRGFVVHAEDLDSQRSIDAISSVMEGGAEAFRKRAEFYERTES